MANSKGIRVAAPLAGLTGFGMRCLRQRLEECSDAVGATLRGLSQARASAQTPDDRLEQIERRLTGALEQLAAAQGELVATGTRRAGRSAGAGR
jgi:hypothetical protein